MKRAATFRVNRHVIPGCPQGKETLRMWKVDEEVPEANDGLGSWTRDELALDGARRMLRSSSSGTKESGMPRSCAWWCAPARRTMCGR